MELSHRYLSPLNCRNEQLVHVKVIKIAKNEVTCLLDNGLLGYIQKLDDLTDSFVSSASEVVSAGLPFKFFLFNVKCTLITS